MRTLEKILVGMAFIGLCLFARTVYAGGSTVNTPFTGDFLYIDYNIINSSGSIQISTFSFTRNYLECRNTGTAEVYISSYSISGPSNLNQGFLLTPATGTLANFVTTTHAAVYAIGNSKSAANPVVTCQEERN